MGDAYPPGWMPKSHKVYMKTKMTGLILQSALVLLSAAPLAAQRQKNAAADSKLLNYMRGNNADPSCGVCLNSAHGYFENIARENMIRLTDGMVKIQGGEYKIGSEKGKGELDEQPRHSVWLDPFYMEKHEVTLAEYQEFVKATRGNEPEWSKPGSRFNMQTGKEKYYQRLEKLIENCPTCPVFGVFWADANAYCLWKNRRLPTEAEWEISAAGGCTTKYCFGDSEGAARNYAWYEDNSDEYPHAVGSKKPNALGIYDMHGNVWEWVQDFYNKTSYTTSQKKNPKGPETGKDHVIRGGSWASGADEMSITNRASYAKANDDIGFRCAASEGELLKASAPY